jgi:hypothetical protein
MLCRSVFVMLLLLVGCTSTNGQRQPTETYVAKVSMLNGKRFLGTLYAVQEHDLYLDDIHSNRQYRIPLTLIRKVVIRYKRRRSTLEGGVVGGGLLAFLTIRSSRQNPFRSPALSSVNLLFATAAGAAAGALIGRNIGPQTRKTIRPFGQTPEQLAESLRGQLDPFTYSRQSDELNRVPF